MLRFLGVWVLDLLVLSVRVFHISASTLYGVTNLVAEVTSPVTHEESLTSDFVGKAES